MRNEDLPCLFLTCSLQSMGLVGIFPKHLQRPEVDHIKICFINSSPAFILPAASLTENRHGDGTSIHNGGALWILAPVSPLRQALQIFRVGVEDAIASIPASFI